MIDEKKVWEIIEDVLSRHGGSKSTNPDVKAAFLELYTTRNTDPAAVGDENIAAAEHYMLSRSWVATGFVPVEQMVSQILAYNSLKEIARRLPGLELLLRNDPAKPTTPPSAEAVKIALRGAWDGEAQRATNGIKKPDWNQSAFTHYSAAQRAP